MVNQLLQDALEADDDEDIELRFTGRYNTYFFLHAYLKITISFR